jgi:hypothetical protein
MPIDPLFAEILDLPQNPVIYGPLTDGTYIPIGVGMGFYVPDEAYLLVKDAARQTGCIQFLTVDILGSPIHGTRDECLDKGCGCVAWISPD